MKKTLFLLPLVVLTSCASLIHGSKQRVSIASDPPGANIYVNGTSTGKQTPAVVSLKRSSGSQLIKLERPGFQTYTHQLQSRFNYLVLLDFMWLFPGVIDVAVGAQNLYDKSVNISLTPTQAPATVQAPIVQKYVFERLSDVDNQIPEISRSNANRFALIIGNEDYNTFQKLGNAEVNVLFARNDASAFREYAIKTLGIPERNITLLLDATAAEMRQGLATMNLIAKNAGGKAELVVFYAGHGLPDEESKAPYLMPVDVAGTYLKLGIPLDELYASLTEHPTERVTVFIDACFSGGARNQGLVAARGVRVKPKDAAVKGNMIVFAASAETESALPYIEKSHGIFTYHLLQQLKNTNGKLSYKELADYLVTKMPLESVLINKKEQHPKTIVSSDVLTVWESWSMNE